MEFESTSTTNNAKMGNTGVFSHLLRQAAAMYLIAGVVVGVLLSLPIFFSPFFDDAFIHARLVNNFIAFGEPSFNQGVLFKADSSTGYLLLLTAATYITGDALSVIRAIQFLTIVLTVSTSIYLVSFARQKLLAICVVASSLPLFLWTAYGGMESSIACMLTVLSLLFLTKSRAGLAVFCIALAVLFRVEMILLCALLSLSLLLKRELRPLLFLFPIGGLLLADFYLYGEIIPSAINVKNIAYGHPLKVSILRTVSFGELIYTPLLRLVGLLFSLVFLIFSFGLAFQCFIKKRGIEPKDAYVFSALAVFAAWATSSSNLFPWYYCLATFPLCAGLLAFVLNRSDKEPEQPLSKFRIASMYFMAFAVFAIGIGQPIQLLADTSPVARVAYYRHIGKVLYEQCPSCTLLTSEIGGLGYEFKGVVYDGFGLGDPDAAKYHPMTVPDERSSTHIGAIPPGYVVERDPDYIVTMPIFSEALQRSPIVSQYSLYHCDFNNHTIEIYDDDKVLLYSRSPLAQELLVALKCTNPA